MVIITEKYNNLHSLLEYPNDIKVCWSNNNSTEKFKLCGISWKRWQGLRNIDSKITLDGKFLHFHTIYRRERSLPLAKVTFPKGFSTSVEKEKHYNNTEEVTKRIEEIVILYFNEKDRCYGNRMNLQLLDMERFSRLERKTP